MLKEVQPRAQKIAEHREKYKGNVKSERLKTNRNAREEHDSPEEGRSQGTIRSSVWLFSRRISRECLEWQSLDSMKFLVNHGSCSYVGSRSYGGPPGFGSEPSKDGQIPEQPKGYESHQ
jgi:hypothetical protein